MREGTTFLAVAGQTNGGYVDMRDRVWLEDHQGPLPHPSCDPGAIAPPWMMPAGS